ncbi:MAG: hypothetical protein WC829_12000 [Hyphomicrobium sp.]|jgi:hypothetical protein
MHRISHTLYAAIATAAFLLVGIDAAWAPGSITLDEVMVQLKDDGKLLGEIGEALKAQGLQADAVICVGARFGGHWVELGGARSIPYECEIGTRKLNIDGTLHLYDERGAEIDLNDERAPERAFDYKQSDLTWTWQ